MASVIGILVFREEVTARAVVGVVLILLAASLLVVKSGGKDGAD